MVVLEEGVVVGAEGVEGRLEAVEVALERLCLPPGAAVLEPDGHLPWLQPELAGQLRLPLRLQLVLLLEAPLQQVDLYTYAWRACTVRINSDEQSTILTTLAPKLITCSGVRRRFFSGSCSS